MGVLFFLLSLFCVQNYICYSAADACDIASTVIIQAWPSEEEPDLKPIGCSHGQHENFGQAGTKETNNKSCIAFPYHGHITNNTTFLVNGFLFDSANQPISNALVEINISGKIIGSATSDKHGFWSYMLTNQLTDGTHIIKASVKKLSIILPSNTFTVDTQIPQAPKIKALHEGSVVNGPVTISGITDPTYEIYLYINNDHSMTGLIYPDQNGSWETTLELPANTYQITAQAQNQASTLSSHSQAISITVAS